MSKTSPTQRTLKECKRLGWTAGIVERRVPFHRITIDYLGCIDIIAATPDGILGIQATSGTNHAARIAKSKAEPKLKAWIAAGGKFEVWSFAKRGPRGKTKTWTLRREAVQP